MLVHLDLGRNKLQGAASEGLDALNNLEHLNLAGNQLTSVGNLAHLTKLEELNLSENKLNSLQGAFPPNLVVLRVNGNEISNFQGLLTPLEKLNELYAHDNIVTDVGPLSTQCPQLESVDLRNNRIESSSQISVLAKCGAIQDIWLHGNPCCYSDSYLIDVMSVFPELKTLDAFTDVQLQRCREMLKNGAISQEELLSSSRAPTPLYRPGSAASRPGSARARTLSGRLATPDTPPVFHTPSARIGNLTKLTSDEEIAKAEEEVRDRLQKMRQLLNRVGNNVEAASTNDDIDQVKRVKPVHRRTSAPVDSISAAIAVKKSNATPRVGGPIPSKLEPTLNTERIPRFVHRVRTIQSLIRRSCVDAGTDPLESLMSQDKPVVIHTPARGQEIETQTTLPPPPLLSVSRSGSLRGLEPHFAREEPNNQPEESESEVSWEPQENGDTIEAEMKQILMQHAVENSSNIQGKAEEQPEEDVESSKFWSDSPRLDPVKTAELRKPPTSLARTGYRSFRMPSRPKSSDSS